MSATQKIKHIIDASVVYFNESYIPSPHVLYFYWDMGVTDLEWAIQDFKTKMKAHLDSLANREIVEVEYDETDPGPIFYLDETNPRNCIEVLEYKLIDAIAKQTMAKMMEEENMEDHQDEGLI